MENTLGTGLTNAVDVVLDVGEKILGFIVANEVMSLFLGITLVSATLFLIRKARG